MKKSIRTLIVTLLLTMLAGIASSQTITLEETKMHWGSFTMYAENDVFFGGSDRHYTNGFKLTMVSKDLTPSLSEAPRWAKAVANFLPDRGLENPTRKLGFAIGQNIYTPENIRTAELVLDDRPYAAWLYGSFAVHVQTESILDVFELSLGVIGPSALGRQIQNGWHNIIGVDEVSGWKNQIHDEPGLVAAYERRFRYVTEFGGTNWGMDFIPYIGITGGNIYTHASVGSQVRFGWKLPSDFGTALIRPGGDSSTHISEDIKGGSFYVFAGVDSKLVARNIFLDGNTWKDSHSVDKREFVSDFVGGFSVRYSRLKMTYAQVHRTKEFYGQVKRDVFGSAAITVLY